MPRSVRTLASGRRLGNSIPLDPTGPTPTGVGPGGGREIGFWPRASDVWLRAYPSKWKGPREPALTRPCTDGGWSWGWLILGFWPRASDAWLSDLENVGRDLVSDSVLVLNRVFKTGCTLASGRGLGYLTPHSTGPDGGRSGGGREFGFWPLASASRLRAYPSKWKAPRELDPTRPHSTYPDGGRSGGGREIGFWPRASVSGLRAYPSKWKGPREPAPTRPCTDGGWSWGWSILGFWPRASVAGLRADRGKRTGPRDLTPSLLAPTGVSREGSGTWGFDPELWCFWALCAP